MERSQASLLIQAKQGDAKAIAALLNQKLQSKGITAKASVKNGCLHIMLEAAKIPPQQPLVNFIHKALTGLTVDAWCAVKVYGRRTSEEIPDWVEEFKVAPKNSQDLMALAKQSDTKAIAKLINQKLQPSDVVAKVSIKDECLQMMLEAPESPNREQMVSFLQSEIQKLEIQGISRLRLYGKQAGEDFPDWQEEVRLIVDKSEPCKVQKSSIELISSKLIEQAPESSAVQKIDSVKLSNQLYAAIQTTCYQHFSYKIDAENDKTVHEMAEDFVNGLEADLKLDLRHFAKHVVDIVESFDFQLEETKVEAMISNVAESNFAGVKLAIRNLERVTQEVLETDFPQETDALKNFFSGVAQGFTSQMIGMAPSSSQEVIIGTVIGSLIAPGIGSVIGGAIGGWFGGNKQQKVLEQLLEKYQQSRAKVFYEWESLLQAVYEKLSNFLHSITSANLITYQVMDQAIDFYHQGNEYIEEDPEKSIEFYDKAIQLNSGLVLAWINKGYTLNQLERFEEALLTIVKALQLDPSSVIAHINYGDALQGLSRNEEAIAAYEDSIKLEPTNYQAWWGKGNCLYNFQRYQEAIAVAQKLVELNPENFLGWYTQAACYALVENKELAIENLKKAIKIDTDSSQKLARTDADFEHLREDEQFKELMESSIGASYASLKKYLKEKQWREADQETANLIKWVIQKISNSTEVSYEALNVFPCTDLETIDSLWRENSDERLGFSVQKRIFQESDDRDIFGGKTGWRIQDAEGNWSWRSNANFNYNFEAMSDGHLPSSLWAGEDGWFENRRDRLLMLFARIDSCLMGEKES